MTPVAQIEAHLAAGALDEARAELAAALEAPAPDPRALLPLATALGMATAAMRCLQLVLADTPDDGTAREELALLYEERGEPVRAAAVRSGAPETPEPQPPAPESTAEPDEGDLLRFLDRFEGREGVYARMWHDPARGVGYSPVHAPLTLDVVRAHMRGAVTVGAYVVRADQRVRFVVFDVDAERRALEAALGDPQRLLRLRTAMREVADRLRDQLRAGDLDPVLVDSGYKGWHLWLLLSTPTPAGAALAFARHTLAGLGPLPAGVHIDLFPRQAGVPADGLGNLVKLPLGVHLRSGRRALLLDDEHRPLARPFERLAQVRLATLPDLPAVADLPEPPPDDLPPEPSNLTPPWTEASFARSPWVSAVLGGCAVLRRVVDDALRDATIDAAAPVVLNHTLGHLPDGPTAVNYLYDRVVGVAAGARMGAPHRGQPMGCANLRGRLASVLAKGVPCACAFPAQPGSYPHPLRHLDDLGQVEPPPSLDDLLARYALQQQRLRAVQDESEALRAAVVQALEAIPGKAWAVDGGEWRIDGGAPVYHRAEGA